MTKQSVFAQIIVCLLIAVSMHAIDFDRSMQLDQHAFQVLPGIEQLMDVARDLYQRHYVDLYQSNQYLRIPHIIHHVWFGKPLSAEDSALRATWQQHHPEWRFVLWTDRPQNDPRAVIVYSWDELACVLEHTHECFIVVQVDALSFANRPFFDAAQNYGEKSDIIKYEIVYRVGGVYVDCDFECLKPLDLLHAHYDFYTGLQPLDTKYAQLGAALFAAKPNHPIVQKAVETIEQDRQFAPIVLRSGPIHFSRAFMQATDQDNNIDIVLPASFFYPCGYEQKDQHRSHWMKPEAYAVHHWAGSWLRPEAFEGGNFN